MKTRLILLKTSLLAVILLASCAPAVSPEPAQPEVPAQPAPVENELPDLPAPTATLGQPTVSPTEVPATEAPTAIPQVVVTSRGPNLEASDPTMVKLDSGELQFVEFFRFT